MKIFNSHYFSDLLGQAKESPRLRQHRNIHESYQDSCQRLFNAIEPGSYICPHRHATYPRDELLVRIRGSMALVTFDDHGCIINVIHMSDNDHGEDAAIAIEICSLVWHTVVALEPGSVLLEVKAGPFDPEQPKDFPTWAPLEKDPAAKTYYEFILRNVESWDKQ